MEEQSRERTMADHVAAYEMHVDALLAREERTCHVERVDVASELGIIVVTSALHLHPSTDLITACLATHQKLEPALATCVHKLIVADCPKVAASRTKFKSGLVSEDDVRRYHEYLDRLEAMCARNEWPYAGWRVLRMESFGGFGFSLKRGLSTFRSLPDGPRYALVLQHDRILKRSFGVADLLLSMRRRPERLRYIGLASNSSRGAVARYSALRIPVQQGLTQTVAGRTLVPLPFWYDSTHVAEVDNYLEVVYGWHVFPGTQYDKPFRLTTGQFPEDKVGNGMLAYMKLHGLRVHPLFGCFLLDDGETVYCRHIHGRKINTGKTRALENYVTAAEVAQNVSSESDDDSDYLDLSLAP